MSNGDSEFTRRKFLSAAALGLACAGMTGFTSRPVSAQAAGEEKIHYRRLGKSGPEIPVISLGAGSTTSPAIIQAAFEKGIRHFDTAAGYNYGSNEQMIGNVLNKMGVRDKANIGTKDAIFQKCEGLSARETIEKTIKLFENSLKRLRTDYIDIYHLYNVTAAEMVNNPGILEGLALLKQQKKAIQIGVSTHTNTADVINETIKHDVFDVIMTSYNFTMADDKTLNDAIAAAGKKGLGFLAMKTQAGGSRWPKPESRSKYSSSTIMTAALKWVLSNKNITSCTPAITNYDILNEDFSVAYDLEYTPEEKEFLKDNNAVLSIGFCRQCRKCLASCPNNADIPTLMRTHMYTAQYGDLRYARATYDSIPRGSRLDACSDCSTCIASCANTVDIKRRIDELKLIYT